MNTKYINLIDQTYYFPQEEFTLEGENLKFHGIPLMDLVEEYGSPLKFTYLPKISENINKAKEWFKIAMEKITTKVNTIIAIVPRVPILNRFSTRP